MPHLIVFSHLRWEFVFQRPQHLLSRLARHYHVVFVEEPMRHRAGRVPRARRRRATGVEVLRPHTPVEHWGFHDDQLSALQPLIAGYLAEQPDRRLRRLVLHADGAAAARRPDAARDRLRLHGRAVGVQERAAPDAPARDRAAEERRPRRHRRAAPLRGQAQCQPERALPAERGRRRALLGAPRDAPTERDGAAPKRCRAPSPRPRLGFFGVIDERLDLDLVARGRRRRSGMADRHGRPGREDR